MFVVLENLKRLLEENACYHFVMPIRTQEETIDMIN